MSSAALWPLHLLLSVSSSSLLFSRKDQLPVISPHHFLDGDMKVLPRSAMRRSASGFISFIFLFLFLFSLSLLQVFFHFGFALLW